MAKTLIQLYPDILGKDELSVNIQTRVLVELGLDPKKLYFNTTDDASNDPYKYIDVSLRRPRRKLGPLPKHLVLEVKTQKTGIYFGIFGGNFGFQHVYSFDLEAGQPDGQLLITRTLSPGLISDIEVDQGYMYVYRVLNRRALGLNPCDLQ